MVTSLVGLMHAFTIASIATIGVSKIYPARQLCGQRDGGDRVTRRMTRPAQFRKRIKILVRG